MTPSTPYSISVRLRRVTTECAHVRVPVDDSVMKQGVDAEGFRRLDMEKVMASAVKLGMTPAALWTLECAQEIMPHPIQSPPKEAGETG
jgi:hypothetical protein